MASADSWEVVSLAQSLVVLRLNVSVGAVSDRVSTVQFRDLAMWIHCSFQVFTLFPPYPGIPSLDSGVLGFAICKSMPFSSTASSVLARSGRKPHQTGPWLHIPALRPCNYPRQSLLSVYLFRLIPVIGPAFQFLFCQAGRRPLVMNALYADPNTRRARIWHRSCTKYYDWPVRYAVNVGKDI